MKAKIIVAAVVIVAFIVFGAVSFLDSNVEYTDFAKAEKTAKKVQVKGAWVKDKETQFDAKAGQNAFCGPNNRKALQAATPQKQPV